MGIEVDEFEPSSFALHPNHNTLYFIGSLDWQPNQEGILWFIEKVWGNVLKDYPEAEFHIAGRNAPNSFKHKLNRKNVNFHGQVEDAREFAMKYNIMVSPLLTGSGMRVKLVEAMALRKPIVSTYVGAEGIPAVNRTHMYLAHNDKDFSDNIAELLKNPEKCRLIADNSRRLVEKQFDNQQIITGLLEFYKHHLDKLR
jgi:glycosyltransferase involved in cell wall biosynthesis